jgi:AcrR family transcriptional regulator
MNARTGGRSQRVVAAVLKVAAEEVTRAGYAGLRVERVAELAGVNKTTVYRRWPTKADLVEAAMRDFLGQREPLPDTGAVRSDLVVMARRALAVAGAPEGRAFMRLIAVESGDPEVTALARTLRSSMLEHRVEIIERAKRRGELPPEVDARVLVDAIFVPLLTRAGRYQEEVDAATAEAFIDLVLAGAEHAPGRTHREAC